jgi:uncharacterized protein YutE (UPF0331/DUF86 family)
MRPIDRSRIGEKLGYIEQAQRRLESLGSMDDAAFLADPASRDSARYQLIVLAEASIDICTHLAARHGRAPETYADCFKVLHEIGVIDEALSSNLQQMARMRNRLVHLYFDIDDTIVLETIRERLGDVDRYREQVARYVGI